MRLALAGLILLACSVCRADSVEAGWVSFSTEHFRLLTNQGHARGAATLSALEQFRGAWLQITGEADSTPSATVLLFSNADEFGRFVGGRGLRVRGVFLPVLADNFVVLAPGAQTHGNEVLFHELAHVYHRASRDSRRAVGPWTCRVAS